MSKSRQFHNEVDSEWSSCARTTGAGLTPAARAVYSNPILQAKRFNQANTIRVICKPSAIYSRLMRSYLSKLEVAIFFNNELVDFVLQFYDIIDHEHIIVEVLTPLLACCMWAEHNTQDTVDDETITPVLQPRQSLSI